MENSHEPNAEESGSLENEGPVITPPSRRGLDRLDVRPTGSGHKRWLMIGGALHMTALAILAIYLWSRYQPASEPEDKTPAKPNFKMVKRGSKIDDGGSRLEKRGSRIEDRGSKIDGARTSPPAVGGGQEGGPAAKEPEPQDIVGEIRTLNGHSNAVVTVAFFPDGRRALSGGADGTLRIWELETGQQLSTLGTPRGTTFGVAISPDGHTALSGGEDRVVHCWDVENAKELFAFQGHLSYITTVAFSPDGRYAMSGSHDQTLRLWDLEAQKGLPVRQRHSGLIRGVAFDPAGADSERKEDRALSCSSEDGSVRLWNLQKPRELRRYKPARTEVWSVAWGAVPGQTKRSRAVFGCSDGMVRLWDMDAWREVRTFPGHNMAVTSVAISPDGRRALSASEDRTIRLWDLETGEELRRFTRETVVMAVVFSPDGRRALSGEADKNLHLWGLPR